MRDYLVPALKAGEWTHLAGDIGIAAISSERLTRKLGHFLNVYLLVH